MSAEELQQEELPLVSFTPGQWARQALAEPLCLLNDHAWLEKKAAANALELLNRWPGKEPPEAWVSVLTGIAKDETIHLAQVTRILARRGGQLSRTHANSYANRLRLLVRKGQGTLELLDRLLVSALIELRSCERFRVLADTATDVDHELASLYKTLWTSEMGHYHVFLKLASGVLRNKPETVDERWQWMLQREAEILAAEPPGPRMHSGMASIADS
ncbi:MAG: tRNA isopentenyl-2-thiomethyl-A-37 hydroxylase MiaE [bacterium]